MFLMLNQDMITFPVSVCFKRLAILFTIILACLGKKRIQRYATWVPFIPHNNKTVFIKMIKNKQLTEY